MKNFYTSFFILFLSSTISLFFLGSCTNDTVNQEISRIVRAKKGNLTRKILETGVVKAVRQISIKSKTGGEIARIYIEEGDFLEKGEDILSFDDKDSLSRLNQAKANLKGSQSEIEQSQIRLQYTRANLENCQNLFKNGLIAQYELEQAKRDNKLARIQLSLVRSNEKYHQETYLAALNEWENTVIKAPISGVVIKKLAEEGEIIAPVSQILLIIGDLSRMEIKTEINEIDINNIKVGQSAEIKFDAIDGRSFQGQVSKIASVGKKRGNIVTYQVGIDILDADYQIKPDMSCNIDLIIKKVENVIYLPIEAVMKKEKKDSVLVKKEKVFVWETVTLGVNNDSYVAIKTGLKEGDEVKYFTSTTRMKESEERIGKRLKRDFD